MTDEQDEYSVVIESESSYCNLTGVKVRQAQQKYCKWQALSGTAEATVR